MEVAGILLIILLSSLGLNVYLGKKVGQLRADNRRLEIDHDKHKRKQDVDPGIAVGDDEFIDSMSEPLPDP